MGELTHAPGAWSPGRVALAPARGEIGA